LLFGQNGYWPFILPIVGLFTTVLCLWLHFHPPHAGLPDRAWLAALFGPMIFLALAQSLPLNWHHPWLTEDLILLGQVNQYVSWSIHSGLSLDMAFWLLSLALLTWCLSALFADERRTTLVMGTVLTMTIYAVYAICIDLFGDKGHQRIQVVGNFSYHNQAGAAWATCLPIAIYYAFTKSRWFWVSVMILLVAVIHTASRTAIILSGAIVVPWFLLLAPRAQRWRYAVVGVVIASVVFSVTGIGAASSRFRELGNGQAGTLNGRSIIWKTVAPVIKDAGAWGSGAGTTPIAMQRAVGIDNTGNILHLHSEPLELLLDYGWAGFLVIITGIFLCLYLIFMTKSPSVKPQSLDYLTIAVFLGLLILGLHSCLDYIFRNPVINYILIIWLATVTQPWVSYQKDRPKLWHTGLWIGICLGLIGLTVFSFLREKECTKAPYVTASNTEQPVALTPEYATAQAVALANSPIRASAWVKESARLAPGFPPAWRARIIVAMASHQRDDALAACERLITWAPDWIAGQDAIIQFLAAHGADYSHDQRIHNIIHALLRDDRPWQIVDLELFASLVGQQVVIDAIQNHASVRVRSAALPWLRKNADLETWRAIRQTIPLPSPLDPIQLPVFRRDQDQRAFSVAIGRDQENRRAQAERCLRAGFLLPNELDRALAEDGDLGALFRQLPVIPKPPISMTLRQSLDSRLHIPWAKAWWTLFNDAEAIENQAWSLLSAHSSPVFLDIAFQAVDEQTNPVLKNRLDSWLEEFSQPIWNDAGWGIQWCWLRIQPTTNSIPLPDGWTGIFIDGDWLGWQRNAFDPLASATVGIHRIILARPP
jgi:O-Antigen ligase